MLGPVCAGDSLPLRSRGRLAGAAPLALGCLCPVLCGLLTGIILTFNYSSLCTLITSPLGCCSVCLVGLPLEAVPVTQCHCSERGPCHAHSESAGLAAGELRDSVRGVGTSIQSSECFKTHVYGFPRHLPTGFLQSAGEARLVVSLGNIEAPIFCIAVLILFLMLHSY